MTKFQFSFYFFTVFLLAHVDLNWRIVYTLLLILECIRKNCWLSSLLGKFLVYLYIFSRGRWSNLAKPIKKFKFYFTVIKSFIFSNFFILCSDLLSLLKELNSLYFLHFRKTFFCTQLTLLFHLLYHSRPYWCFLFLSSSEMFLYLSRVFFWSLSLFF